MAYLSTYRDFPTCFTEGELWNGDWDISTGTQVSVSGKPLVGPGTTRPIGLTYREFFELNYRVFSLRFIASAVASATSQMASQNLSAPTIDKAPLYAGYPQEALGSLPAKGQENRLACGCHTMQGQNGPQADVYLDESEPAEDPNRVIRGIASTEIRIPILSNIDLSATIIAGGLFYPSMLNYVHVRTRAYIQYFDGPGPNPRGGVAEKLFWTLGAGSSGAGNYGQYLKTWGGTSNSETTSTRDYLDEIGSGTYDIEFLGRIHTNVFFYREMFDSRGYFANPALWIPVDNRIAVDFSGISLDVEATEYREYDPGDGGGPIYDSSTGAQLRDPFSIVM